ncbi:MAG: ATP-binding protein [Bryobacteraceae bacterium]|jgi:hypothetical protein
MPNSPFRPAPGDRAAPDAVQRQSRLIKSMTPIAKILNAAPAMAMVLNRERQIVALNQRLLDFVGAAGAEEVLGLRPGEILECMHAAAAEDGCGTSESCAFCGALRAILDSQVGCASTRVCRIRRRGGQGEECANLEVHASPLALGEEQFTILFAADAGGRVRADFLEHGVLPEALAQADEIEALVAGLAGWNAPELRERTASALAAAAAQLSSILKAYGEIVKAETGELRIALCRASALGALRGAAAGFPSEETAAGRQLRIAPGAEDAEVCTDPAQLGRILHSMVLNALDASPPQSVVTLDCRRSGERAEFWVHNDGEMPEAVRLQIFQRGFTTKGPGHGFGAYRMKLIAERFLGGAVSFRSSQQEGTTFLLSLPLASDRAPEAVT